MTSFVFVSNCESDTERFGAALAQSLRGGAIVALVGTLGAGKTRLVQAVATAAGVDPGEVVSPTFVLVHEYRTSRQGSGFRAPVSANADASWPNASKPQSAVSIIYHLDAYRIRDEDEFRNLGPEEYFESDGWTFVEWADRVASCIPTEHLRIEIDVTRPEQRRFTVTAADDALCASVERLRAILTPQT